MNETILNYIKSTQINDSFNESVLKISIRDIVFDKYKITEKLSVSSSVEGDIYKVL